MSGAFCLISNYPCSHPSDCVLFEMRVQERPLRSYASSKKVQSSLAPIARCYSRC
uniref:Uncharacterized protein n=1 Tax=Utricularia reniformis TaxID=192314 RepID=A0A1Y0B3Y6_9LAMI|nr:hypothetical protein AEK19_MT1939 [Utricularia reniformis]ART32104.1 hypothetical protein AEK19_MT1939 [Utricularia reniformis]